VRFRVNLEDWVDQAPVGPVESKNMVEMRSPYTITASLDGAGLGPVDWWDGGDVDEE
jgi:RNA polymerase III subunit Rpc25